jgi:hypothetical protein
MMPLSQLSVERINVTDHEAVSRTINWICPLIERFEGSLS